MNCIGIIIHTVSLKGYLELEKKILNSLRSKFTSESVSLPYQDVASAKYIVKHNSNTYTSIAGLLFSCQCIDLY